MKTFSLIFIYFIMLNSLIAQTAQDEAAIKAVIGKETQAYFGRDLEAWKSCYVQQEEALQVWNNRDGSVGSQNGWKTILATAEKDMQTYPKAIERFVEQKNFVFRNYGNAAFVTFDQYIGDWQGKKITPTREARMMEKVKDEWKILAVLAFWDYPKEMPIEKYKN